MRRSILLIWIAITTATIVAGCRETASNSDKEQSQTRNDRHAHERTARRGAIVAVGDDEYHVEALVTADGELRLYPLGHDTSEIVAAPIQKVTAYAQAEGGSGYVVVELEARRQSGDAENKASLFVGRLAPELAGKELRVTVPNFALAGERFRLAFIVPGEAHDDHELASHEEAGSGSSGHSSGSSSHVSAMPGANTSIGGAPPKVTSDAERTLYLTPGGLYTWADIDANGQLTGSQKFAAFEPAHDLEPKPGDKICPITLTKANPNCSWIVGGKNYEFCCPPCVDEFVKLAKSKPAAVKRPEEYVQTETGK